MNCVYLFIVGLLSLATAEVPCRLYDVTTMVRLLGKKVSAAHKGVSGISNYEVHSRTNAVGAPVEFNHPDWFTSFKDPLESNRCDFSTTNASNGWTTEGFVRAHWVPDDPLFNWKKVDKFPHRVLLFQSVSLNGTREPKVAFKHPLPDESGALKLRFRPGPELKLYFGLYKSDGAVDPPRRSNDEEVKSGSGDGPIDDDESEDDDPGEVRRTTSRSSHGLEFTYLSNSSTMFEEKRLDFDNDLTVKEAIIGHQGILESPRADAVVTLFVTKNDDGTFCLWAENLLDPAPSNKKCLLELSSGYDAVVVFMDRDYDLSTFDVYRADLRDAAVQALRDPSWVMTPEMPPGRKGSICFSFKYSLSKSSRTHVKFLPVVNGITGVALRSYVQSTGKPATRYRKAQFEIIMTKSLRKQAWKLKVEFSSNTTFILQSIRRCSGKGRDDITVPLWMPEYRNASHGRVVIRNGDEVMTSLDRAIDALVPKVGLGVKCPYTELSTKSEVTKCYNGGVNVDGWCQCFPGFTGPLCKKACPPERFGADCSGSCNHLGKHDCVGIKMAAPGNKLQCARGYYGLQCDKRCETGFYGQDCQLKCGHCSRETCNRYTGLCDGSCQAGYGGPSCDTEIAEVYQPYINATGYNFIEGYLNVTLSDETIGTYPFFEIRYVLLKFPYKKSKKLLKLTSKTPVFRIERMKPGQRYRLHAVLVHQSGEVSRGEVRPEDTTVVETDCNANTNFSNVDVDPGKGVLSLRWNVTESDDPYLCQRTKYQIEIDSDNLEDPIIEEAEPNDNHKTITALLPNEGTVRIKPIYTTKEGEWSDHYPFMSTVVTEKPSVLNVLKKTSRAIEFLWSKADTGLQDIITCEGEAMLCRGIPRGKVTANVTEGIFVVEDLDPFTVYTCTLENFGTTISTITEQEIPSSAPKHHPTPVKSVKNTTATIQWLEPECFSINGLQQGFKLMLYRDGKLINTTEVSDDKSLSIEDEHFYTIENLEPDTEYEAKIFVLNHIGENPKYPLNISFKTKSTNPEAVRNLIVYKRTKNDLWLRWSEPEDFTYIAGSSAKISDDFKIVYSYPDGVLQSEEIAMTRCKTWPDYFCHRIRGLVPNKEYTVSVLSRDSAHKMYGPSSVVNATTTEGVPDPPKNLQLVVRTTNSIVVSWEIPVMLNSNTKYFVASVEASAESESQEFDSPVTKIPISDGIHLYQAKFDNLRPASTYTVTVGAGMLGTRATLIVHTPPPDPPTPISPDLLPTTELEVAVHGLENASDVKHLSGYLLLVSSNVSLPGSIFDEELQSILGKKFAEKFYVAQEYPKSLVKDTFVFTPSDNFNGSFTSDNFNGSFSLIQRTPVSSEQWIALAALCQYNGLYSASVSDATFLDRSRVRPVSFSSNII